MLFFAGLYMLMEDHHLDEEASASNALVTTVGHSVQNCIINVGIKPCFSKFHIARKGNLVIPRKRNINKLYGEYIQEIYVVSFFWLKNIIFTVSDLGCLKSVISLP